MPRHRRNPKRAYDADGREIPPATIANSKANNARGLLVFCECGHGGALPFDRQPDDAIVPDVDLRLVCSARGGDAKGIETGPDFTGRSTALR